MHDKYLKYLRDYFKGHLKTKSQHNKSQSGSVILLKVTYSFPKKLIEIPYPHQSMTCHFLSSSEVPGYTNKHARYSMEDKREISKANGKLSDCQLVSGAVSKISEVMHVRQV